MVEIKIKQNFSVEKLLKNIGVSTSILLNEIAKPIKEGWDEELKGNFQPLKKSTEKLHGSHRPLHLTGKLSKSNKIIKATPKRLKAVVKNTAKSSKNYKIKTPKGKVYKGTRKSPPVFYGYYQNYGFTTSSSSLIPNRDVPPRDFTTKTFKNIEKTHEYRAAQKKFAKNLDESMKVALK